MDYVCINCSETWRIGEPSDELSGGLCVSCTKAYVRTKQKNNGYHDCFGRNTELCSNEECSYLETCNKIYIRGEMNDNPHNFLKTKKAEDFQELLKELNPSFWSGYLPARVNIE